MHAINGGLNFASFSLSHRLTNLQSMLCWGVPQSFKVSWGRGGGLINRPGRNSEIRTSTSCTWLSSGIHLRASLDEPPWFFVDHFYQLIVVWIKLSQKLASDQHPALWSHHNSMFDLLLVYLLFNSIYFPRFMEDQPQSANNIY